MIANPWPFRVAAVVTVVNVLVAGGFAVAGLVAPASILPPGAEPNEAALAFARYAAARTLPLALFAVAAVARRSAPGVLLLGLLAGVVQVFDAAIGVFLHDVGKTVGPLVIAVAQFAAVWWLNQSAKSSA